jgi:hypothetical protein
MDGDARGKQSKPNKKNFKRLQDELDELQEQFEARPKNISEIPTIAARAWALSDARREKLVEQLQTLGNDSNKTAKGNNKKKKRARSQDEVHNDKTRDFQKRKPHAKGGVFGLVMAFFYAKEWQGRGSPHIHGLEKIWGFI